MFLQLIFNHGKPIQNVSNNHTRQDNCRCNYNTSAKLLRIFNNKKKHYRKNYQRFIKTRFIKVDTFTAFNELYCAFSVHYLSPPLFSKQGINMLFEILSIIFIICLVVNKIRISQPNKYTSNCTWYSTNC